MKKTKESNKKLYHLISVKKLIAGGNWQRLAAKWVIIPLPKSLFAALIAPFAHTCS
ncbi:hypothetical protein [Brasilonema bromeliae]|uniref:hypothetical protein n=1 Tax=Brasilonema bromeliae TaxID=383615 RepID=UPI001B7CFC36|nr:hypothetical protein [Brasilonema bromeliae]